MCASLCPLFIPFSKRLLLRRVHSTADLLYLNEFGFFFFVLFNSNRRRLVLAKLYVDVWSDNTGKF